MLFEPHQQSIGLDISDRSLKAVQLRRNLAGKLQVAAAAERDLPPTVFEDGEIKQPDVLAKAIMELLTQPQLGDFSTPYVVACLPETKTFIKMIDVPPMSDSEIPQAIRWEAEHHIPIPIDETYWDWQRVNHGHDHAGGNARLPVLLGVVPKHIADSYTQAISDAKLVPLALEIEAVAISRSLLPVTDDGSTTASMVIDFGATRTSLIVVDRGTIQFTMSLPTSGRKITETISATLKLTEDQAEKAKLVCGLDPKKCHGAIAEILHAAMDELVHRIREAISFYREHFPQGNAVAEVVLCGGGANFKLIDAHLGEKLDLTVRRGNPWLNLEPSPTPLKPAELLSYTTAIGLGLRTTVDESLYD